MIITDQKTNFLNFVYLLQEMSDKSKSRGDDYFDPSMTDNMDKYCGKVSSNGSEVTICTDVKGLRYENRTLLLETLYVGDSVVVKRDVQNIYNANNFNVLNEKMEPLGTFSAELCNVLAPLYDIGFITIEKATVSYVEKIRERSRYAQQGVLFVEIKMKILQ